MAKTDSLNTLFQSAPASLRRENRLGWRLPLDNDGFNPLPPL